MKFKELKEKTAEELKEERRDLKLEMMNLRVQKASGQLENPARIKIVRRTIAKIETLLSEKKSAAPADAQTEDNSIVNDASALEESSDAVNFDFNIDDVPSTNKEPANSPVNLGTDIEENIPF